MKIFTPFILLSFAISFSLNLFAQDKIAPRYDRRNRGLAKELVGEVTVLGIFIDENGAIKNEMKDEYVRSLIKAERWLIKEAKRYDKNVSFVNYYLGREQTLVYKPKTTWSQEVPHDVIRSAFGGAAYAYEWFNQHPNCAVIIFTPTQEWCTARPISANMVSSPKPPVMEFARIHYYDMKDKHMEIAHEMLHLFGAWDLYNTSMFRGEWKNYVDQLTVDCKSIMYDVWGDINAHHVDELNAFLIGWTNEWKEWYLYFQN